MSDTANLLDSYNENVYLRVLELLVENLSNIEAFLSSIGAKNDFKNIEELTHFYESTFTNALIEPHISFKIDRIAKSVFFRLSEPFHKGNSYYHITLKLKSEVIIELDKLYNSLLSRVIKFHRHLFSKIDNYFISLDFAQLKRYELLLAQIKKEILKFIESSANREIIERREKLKEKYLKQLPFAGLFYISHLNNVESILNHGILSHNVAHQGGFVKVDISNNEVNRRRNRIEASLGGNIHDFAPLYFNPKNPMLYTLCKNGIRDNIVLFRITPHILLVDGVAFSDGNAAVKSTQFYRNIDEFNNLNWAAINDRYWTNYPDGTRIRCSEALVLGKIPLQYVENIYVYSIDALNQILPLFPNHRGIRTTINKAMYF